MAREPFRRALGGYDREQVDAAIYTRDARLAQLEREAQRLTERVRERERQLDDALGGEGGLEEASPGAIGALSRRLEEIHAQARAQATRIRMKALQDVVQISDRVQELSRLRDDLTTRVQELAGMAGIKLAPEQRPPVGTRPAGDAPPGGVYRGPVEVEIGPLDDFAQLTGFEDAAAAIEGASEITVRRFSGGRATLSLDLTEPVELLAELERLSPFDFRVRDIRGDAIVIDVEPDGRSRAA